MPPNPERDSAFHALREQYPDYNQLPEQEKKEADTLDTVRKIVKAGTQPLSENLAEIIKLPECSYWNDPSLCPLRERFYVPKEALTNEEVKEEYLKYPIVCKLANRFKCYFVKDYYYDLRPRKEPEEKDIINMEEEE